MCMYVECGGCCYKTQRNRRAGESKKGSIQESVDARGGRVGWVAEGACTGSSEGWEVQYGVLAG